MKKPISILILAVSSLNLNGQTTNVCDDPQITSWSLNIDGELADYQTNCCPPTNTLTPVQLNDSAGVKEIWYNNNNVYIKTNSLAYFTMGPWDTKLVPSSQDLLVKIPRSVTEDLSGDKNTAESGTIGIAVDGVAIFSETTSQSYNSTDSTHVSGDGIWNEDAWVDEAWSLDSSGNGHTNATGKYHYHASPIKLYSDISQGHSEIIGWGLDGVPIYGPYGYADSLDALSPIVRIETSYQLRNISDRTTLADGTVLSSDKYGPSIQDYELGTYVEDYEYSAGLGHLDEHNGRWCVTPEYPSGVYAYFVTEDGSGNPAFPYFIGPEFYGETANGNSLPNNASQYNPSSCTITSLKSSLSKKALSFYPNPTKNEITIDLSIFESNDVTLKIINSLGQIVHQENPKVNTAVKVQFNLSPGIYHVSVSSIKATYSGEVMIK